ncbi:chloramphenicol phosphotransferase CPT family protein [Amycolatopsis pretoriensis]|uniref:chloramphenicol phosphotransferase CPT family protein n=1 Tax=Amycolatopsis pretoriensis TaxID=218821 RepID=UPI001FC908FD
MPATGGGITISDDGEVTWAAGLAAMVRTGARIVVDEVFLSGAESQRRFLAALDGLDVLWVGVRCDAAEAVHRGVRYDVEVDTTHAEPVTCAKTVAARVY